MKVNFLEKNFSIFSSLPVRKLSKHITSLAVSFNNLVHRLVPIKPAPPVTKIFEYLVLDFYLDGMKKKYCQ